MVLQGVLTIVLSRLFICQLSKASFDKDLIAYLVLCLCACNFTNVKLRRLSEYHENTTSK